MANSTVSFKKDGKITLCGLWVGIWSYEDIWATLGTRDMYGCRLVKCLWHAYLINGEHIYQYTRKELREAIERRWSTLFDLAMNSTDDQKQTAINGVEFYAEREVRTLDEMTGKLD